MSKRRKDRETEPETPREDFDDDSRARVHESVSRLIASQRTLVAVEVEDERGPLQ